jgi:hypothetical protein
MRRAELTLLVLALSGCTSSQNELRPGPEASDHPLGTSGQARGAPDLTPKDYARIPPVPPTGLQVTTEGKKAIVSWKPSQIASVTAYRVYRKTKDGGYVSLGQVHEARFVDKDLPRGTVSYSVAAVTSAGTEGPKSEVALKTATSKASAKK